jgi:hypothetical protein
MKWLQNNSTANPSYKQHQMALKPSINMDTWADYGANQYQNVIWLLLMTS